MTLEELEVDPTSKVAIFQMSGSSSADRHPETLHTFWVVGQDGSPKRMMWNDQGDMVEADDWGYA